MSKLPGSAVGYGEAGQVGVGECDDVRAIGRRPVQQPGDQIPTPLGGGPVVCGGRGARGGLVGPRVADPQFLVDSGQRTAPGCCRTAPGRRR